MSSADELLQKALATTQSSLRLSYLRQVVHSKNSDFIEPLLQSSVKESNDETRVELLRTALTIVTNTDQDFTPYLKHQAWEGCSEVNRIDSCLPLLSSSVRNEEFVLPSSMKTLVMNYLTAAEAKQALRNQSSIAWALALKFHPELINQNAEAYLQTGSLLLPSKSLTAERSLIQTHLVLELLRRRPDLVLQHSSADLSTNLRDPSLANLAVISLIQAVEWTLNSSNKETQRYQHSIRTEVCNEVSRLPKDVAAPLLSTYITLFVTGVFAANPSTTPRLSPASALILSQPLTAAAQRSVLRALLSAIGGGFDALTCAAFWSILALEKQSTRRRSQHRLGRLIKELHLPAPLPTSEFALFLKDILKSNLYGSSVPFVIRFFNESQIRHWEGADAHLWSDWMKSLLQNQLLFSEATNDPDSPIWDGPQTKPSLYYNTPSTSPTPTAGESLRPKASTKPVVKAKAKVSAAAARLMKAVPTPTNIETARTTTTAPTDGRTACALFTEYGVAQVDAYTTFVNILAATHALVESWPMVCATRISDMLEVFSSILRHTAKKDSKGLRVLVMMLLDKLVATFISTDAVPQKAILPAILFDLSQEKGRTDLAAAEKVCAGLNDMCPLGSEASSLVLPVIMALLSGDRTSGQVSFVAVHRAMNTILFQLRLGSKMDSNTLLRVIQKVLRDKPALLPICEKIVMLLDDQQTNMEALNQLMDCDSASFRRAVFKKISMKLSATEQPTELPNVVLFAKYDQDEEIRAMASSMSGDVQISECVKALDCSTTTLQKCIGRTIAGVYRPELAVEVLINAFKTTFHSPEELVPSSLKGFKLSAADLERIKAKQQKNLNEFKVTTGQHGCIFALGCIARQGPLPERLSKCIVNFILAEVAPLILLDNPNPKCESFLRDCDNTVLSTVMNSKEYSGAMELFVSKMIKEGVLCAPGEVIAVNSLASLASFGDGAEILDLLLDMLLSHTGVEADMSVKRAVAKVLPNLLRQRSRLAPLIDKGEQLAFESKDMKAKVAGALLLAACIRAEGWNAYGGVDRLTLMKTERKEPWVRHGVYLVLDATIESFGRAIEPQAKEIAQLILSGDGDSSLEIRETSRVVSRKFVKALSGSSALREILPLLLEYTGSSSWRTKVGALDMLAYLVSSSVGTSSLMIEGLLSQVLPILIDASHAPHKEVKEVGQRTLRNLLAEGDDSIIKHPDTKLLSPFILDSLREGNESNILAFLKALGGMTLTHKLDASSVCIIHMLLLRAIRMTTSSSTSSGVRSEIREKACQLIGVLPYMCANPEQDLGPLIKKEGLLTELFKVLGAPTPIIRQTCARTIGLLTEVLGSCLYREILPYLIKTLKQVDNVVERSGCANALVEVLRALGKPVLSQHLPDILRQAGAPRTSEEDTAAFLSAPTSSSVREGFLGLFVYFPLIFGDDFKDFVPECLPVLIQGLEADEESVRDIAFRAIKIFVQQYGSTHTPLLLAPIESALFNESPEVRLRAVGLLGTLVNKILKGVEDSNYEGGEQMQLEVLSLERRAYILSAIFIVRSGDEDAEVRHSASNVWKGVVQNTPRTVKELLPLLTKRLMDLLASNQEFKESAASRSMNELVSKHGERLLPDILNVLCKTFEKSKSPNTFKGVFLGFQSVISASPPLVIKKHIPTLIPVIRKALLDTTVASDTAVRLQAMEEVVKAISLLAASEEAAKEELAQQAKKSGSKKGAAKPAAKSSDVSLTHSSLLKPLLEDVIAEDGRLSPEDVESLLSTFALIMKQDASLLVEDVMQKCRDGDLSPVRLRLLGTLCYAGSAIVSSELRSVCRILEKSFSACASEKVSEFVDEVRVLLDNMMNVVNAEHIAEVVVPNVIDMVELNAPQMVCTVTDWDRLCARKTCPEICSAEAMTNLTSITDRESRDGAQWGRFVCLCLVDALFKTSSLADLWMKTVTSSVMPQLLPAAFFDLHTPNIEQGALWLQSMTKNLDRTLLVPIAVQIWRILQLGVNQQVSNPLVKERIRLPGLQNKCSMEAIVAILQPALLYGTPDVKEKTAEAFQLLIEVSDTTIMTNVAVKIAGQLIRGFAEKTSVSVKKHILISLTLLLKKVGSPLRLLVPQLQSSFVRCIGDEELGIPAAHALTLMAGLAGPRVNLLVSELAKSLHEGANGQYEAPLIAIEGVLATGGSSLTPASLAQLRNVLISLQDIDNPLVATALKRVDELTE